MTFEDFEAEDFIMEQSFQEYCLGTNKESVIYWERWIKNSPEKKSEIDKAKELFFLLNGNHNSETFKKDEAFFKNRLVEKGILDSAVIKILPHKPVSVIKRYLPYAAAAAILVFFVFKFYPSQKEEDKTLIVEQNNTSIPGNEDVIAGSDKAILTLSDGRNIVLDSTSGGNILVEGAAIGLSATELTYNEKESHSVTYNTITTPKGGQFRVILADGSKVWLNAHSSLRYPTSFPGTDRVVELKGEAYFEIAPNAKQPFFINFNKAAIEVLGTHFNISSYDDDPIIKSTLLEGSIKLTLGDRNVILKKGQQAQFANSSSTNISSFKVLNDTDLDQVVAWKNGIFNFDNEHISDIMRQLSRWYDVEVFYKGSIPNKHYTGSIRKSVNISEVIKMLDLAGGVKITLNNKTLTVQEK